MTTTAQYRLSLTGGSDWGSWLPAAAIQLGPAEWVLQAHGVAFAHGQDNRIQFKIDTSDVVSHISPAYSVWVDLEPPVLSIIWPTSNALVTGTELVLIGTASDALSGLDRLEVWINGAVITPVQAPSTWLYTWTLPIVDGLSSVVSASTRDRAMNVVTRTVPFTVDTVAPQNPEVLTEAHGIMSGAILTRPIELRFTWPAVQDGTGVAGYRLYWGADPEGTGLGVVTGTVYQTPELTSYRPHYFRLSTMDRARNQAPWKTMFTVRLRPTVYLPRLTKAANPDYFEPNNALNTAYGPLISGRLYKAFIWPSGDEDYYYIDVTTTTTLTISLTNIPVGVDYDLYVYDTVTATQPITWSNRYGNADELVAYPVSKPGRYFIRIYPYSGYSADQPYHLIANLE